MKIGICSIWGCYKCVEGLLLRYIVLIGVYPPCETQYRAPGGSGKKLIGVFLQSQSEGICLNPWASFVSVVAAWSPMPKQNFSCSLKKIHKNLFREGIWDAQIGGLRFNTEDSHCYAANFTSMCKI